MKAHLSWWRLPPPSWHSGLPTKRFQSFHSVHFSPSSWISEMPRFQFLSPAGRRSASLSDLVRAQPSQLIDCCRFKMESSTWELWSSWTGRWQRDEWKQENPCRADSSSGGAVSESRFSQLVHSNLDKILGFFGFTKPDQPVQLPGNILTTLNLTCSLAGFLQLTLSFCSLSEACRLGVLLCRRNKVISKHV